MAETAAAGVGFDVVLPTKVGKVATDNKPAAGAAPPVKEGKTASKINSRVMKALVGACVATLALSIGVCLSLWCVADSAEIRLKKVVHVHIGTRSFSKILAIASSPPRRLRQAEDEADTAAFDIGATADASDVVALADVLKKGKAADVDIKSCPANSPTCVEKPGVAALGGLVADLVEEAEPGEITVGGLMPANIVSMINETAGRRLESAGGVMHYEINCDLNDAERNVNDGCEIELFNLDRESSDPEAGQPRRLCGRRRRRRRRRQDVRRRRNIRRKSRSRRLAGDGPVVAKSGGGVLRAAKNSSDSVAAARSLQYYDYYYYYYYCAWGCPPEWIENGACESDCNNAECNWDGGDCKSTASTEIMIFRNDLWCSAGTTGATIGRLEVWRAGGMLGSFDTLEDGCESQAEGSGCRIPDGEYAAHHHDSPKFGLTYWLQNTYPRSEILIHAGNHPGDTEGCILVGTRDGSSFRLGYGSKASLMSLLDTAGTPVLVRIQNNVGLCLSDGSSAPSPTPPPPPPPPPPCFPGSARVQLEDGSWKRISELVAGESIRTFSSTGELLHEPYLMDFHGRNVAPFPCLRLKHLGGDVPLEVSPNHLLFVALGAPAVRAASLRPGDRLLVGGPDGKLTAHNITVVEEFMARGAYAPLTFSGQMLVEGVAASSYGFPWPEAIVREMEAYPAARQAILHAHDIMHAASAPLRWGSRVAAPIWSILGLAEQRQGVEMHWFAARSKGLLEGLIFNAYPGIYASIQEL